MNTDAQDINNDNHKAGQDAILTHNDKTSLDARSRCQTTYYPDSMGDSHEYAREEKERAISDELYQYERSQMAMREYNNANNR